jgi:hypothetical protein
MVVVITKHHTDDYRMFHVHAAGCNDLQNSRRYPGCHVEDSYRIDAKTIDDCVLEIYGAHIAGSEGTIAEYAEDFRVFPCADLS